MVISRKESNMIFIKNCDVNAQYSNDKLESIHNS